jgi:viroplasmin and RNaseH domain-containing protein
MALAYDTSILGIEMAKWYVVYQGRVLGVYDEWDDWLKQVNGFKGNNYKG